MLAIIDADSIGFSIASSIWKQQKDDPEYVHTDKDYYQAIELFLAGIYEDTNATESQLWLTPKESFRKELVPEYKSNRKGKEKPPMLGDVVEVMKQQFDAEYAQDGFEADDEVGQIAKDFWNSEKEDDCVICSIDKDLDTIPGWHYRWGTFNRDSKMYFLTEEEAMHFFWIQVLAGDPGDGIKGIPGIGPKKAEAYLLGCVDQSMYYDACQDTYKALLKDKMKEDEILKYFEDTLMLLEIGKEGREDVYSFA